MYINSGTYSSSENCVGVTSNRLLQILASIDGSNITFPTGRYLPLTGDSDHGQEKE
jgi:hypothetical protein